MAKWNKEQADVYRLKVVRHSYRFNEERVKDGKIDWAAPTGWFDGPIYEEYSRPYSSLSVARGRLTSETRGYRGELLEGIVSAEIQKATTTWETVE